MGLGRPQLALSQRPAALHGLLAEPVAQPVDGGLGCNPALHRGVGEIGGVGLLQRQDRRGADTDEPERRAVDLARQKLPGRIEQAFRQDRGSAEPGGAGCGSGSAAS